MDGVAAEAANDPRPQAAGWFDPSSGQPASALRPADRSTHSRPRTAYFVATAAALGAFVLLWSNTLCLAMQTAMMEAREDSNVALGLGAALIGMVLATPAFIALLSPAVPRVARTVAALLGLGLFANAVTRPGRVTPVQDLAEAGPTWATALGLLTPTVALVVILVAALPRTIGSRRDPAPAVRGWVAGLLAVPVATALWLLTAVAEYALRFANAGSSTLDWSGLQVLASTKAIRSGPAVAALVAAGLLYGLLLHHRVPPAALIVSGLALAAGAVAGLVTTAGVSAGDAGIWSTLTAVPTNGSAALLAGPLLVLGIVRRRMTRSAATTATATPGPLAVALDPPRS